MYIKVGRKGAVNCILVIKCYSKLVTCLHFKIMHNYIINSLYAKRTIYMYLQAPKSIDGNETSQKKRIKCLPVKP